MTKDITKLILTSLVLIVLLLAAFVGGILAGRWLKECPDQVWIDPNRLDEIVHHVNKQVFIEHENVLDIHYTGIPKVGWEWLEKLGIKQDFRVHIRGRVPVGFDLDAFDEQHIWISANGKHVQFVLPPPTVFEENVSIDFENSYVIAHKDICPDWFCNKDLEMYQNEALPAAKKEMIERALEAGVLRQVAWDGKAYYEQFLKSLGFEQVDVIVIGY